MFIKKVQVTFPSISMAVLLTIAALLATPETRGGALERERITGEGEGEAEIQDQNLSGARREALENALQKALENALAEILPADLSPGGRQDIYEQLGPRLKRYLLQYRVLSEMPALQVFFLNVEATFSVSLIREDLAGIGIDWGEEAAGEPVEVFVRINGVPSVRWYQELLQSFERMAHVNLATTFEVFGTSMVIRLECERGVEELLTEISGWRLEGLTFRVEQVMGREITVSLATADAGGDSPSPHGSTPPVEVPHTEMLP